MKTVTSVLLISVALLCVLFAVRVRRIGRLLDAAPAAVTFDPVGEGIVAAASDQDSVHVIAVKPGSVHGQPRAVLLEVTRRGGHRGPLLVRGERSDRYHILKVEAAEPGPAIAAVLLGIQELTGRTARVDFAWPDGSHARNLLRFLLFGTGTSPQSPGRSCAATNPTHRFGQVFTSAERRSCLLV